MTAARPQKSTNVRTQVRIARGALRALGVVSPPLAGRVALHLFTQTARRAPREGERDALCRAVRFVVPFERERLVAWSWGRGPAVLLAHGWNGRGTQLAPFVGPLVGAGLRVIAFDNVGHGDSTGAHATLADFARAITRVADAVGGAHAVIAHSLGGAATAIAVHDGLALERAVLIASPTDPMRWVAHFSELLALDPRVEAPFRDALAERAGRPPSALRLEALAPRLRVPMLAIHDTDDREVPVAASVALTRAWTGSALVTTSGLGHQRILCDPDVIARSVRFVAEPLSRREGAPA
ncbi:MAG: alpha/beta fold hydrolase [Sandaracinaceae bacterium]|nr:alpha/beta fold hydrolase [Sandaracinaceae bacterium]